jgi:manganese-dependent inorganic pyrophosphatase
MQEGSELLVVSDDTSIIEKAYDISLVDNKAWLPGVMSRKKQVVPPLQDTFAK